MVQGEDWGVRRDRALVILKLIDAQFFYPDLVGTVAIVSYLTYAGYLTLGIMVAVCFGEDGVPQQVRRNRFVYGLLAPSILLAILKAPTAPPGSDVEGAPAPRIPTISSLLAPRLLAQQPEATRPAAPDVIVVNNKDLWPTTPQAFREYLEVFYNQRRRHSTIGYIRPAAYEQRSASAGGA